MDCIFCKIIAGDIPSAKVYEDELVYAFRDIAPMAPTHILIVPKAHLASADEVTAENSAYVARIFEVIPGIAAAEGLVNGYRVITNCGEDACQSVKHLHFHILGGKKLSENIERELMIDTFYSVEATDVDENGCDELVCRQYAWVEYHAEHVGDVVSTIRVIDNGIQITDQRLEPQP